MTEVTTTPVSRPEHFAPRLESLRDGGRSLSDNQNLINEANNEYRQRGGSTGAAAYHAASEGLKENGTLPNVMITEFGKLDTDGNKTITRAEIDRLINMGRNVPFLTAMAARTLRENLQKYGGWDVDANGNQSISQARFEAFWRARQADLRNGSNPPAERRETPGAPQPPREGQPRRPERLNENLIGRPGEQTPEQRKIQDQLDIIQSGNGSFEDRLKAVKELHKLGVKNFQMVDSNGDVINTRIQVARINGNTDAVYLHGRHERGREQLMLRGIDRNGTFEQQRNIDGSKATYAGTLWTKARPTSVLTRDNTPPPPVPLPQPRPRV